MPIIQYQIRLEDLSGEVRQLAELIGLESLLAMADAMGGGFVYIPQPNRLALSARNRCICSEFNGSNLRELAAKHKITIRQVRTIIEVRRQGKRLHHNQVELKNKNARHGISDKPPRKKSET